jgi:hypothetical protein
VLEELVPTRMLEIVDDINQEQRDGAGIWHGARQILVFGGSVRGGVILGGIFAVILRQTGPVPA